ncbi:GPP34 family phosphoprotein [Streptomyces sp. NBC_00102]|uniref:GOLPH3/VPS74 family protein n=1 Tax=Streptomyces sp. NBC_00102 TaxID=2975652 RepID=UPI00225B5AA5|nr:GPP34 family phosphoprotein [Streptomyces sp. NBC_00102]MCX5398977.1 GPP34 family phosphoprotein [Streptomyces sp. NBC_00102]
MDTGLTVGERIALLGLDQRDGTPRDHLRVGAAVAAAPLLRLVRTGGVVARDGKLVATGVPAPGEPLAAAVAAQVREHPEARPQSWLLAVRDQAVTTAYEGLRAKGVVHREGRKVLGAFGSYRYPVTDASVPEALRSELAGVVLDGAAAGPETAELITLLHHAGLHARALPDADPDVVKERMGELAATTGPSGAVGEAVAAALAALTVLLVGIPGLAG